MSDSFLEPPVAVESRSLAPSDRPEARALAPESPSSESETVASAEVVENLEVVVAGSCGTLDREEITRLLLRELALVAVSHERFRAPSVRLDCSPETISVEVEDRATRATVVRTFPTPVATGPARAQEIALAVSQAFLSSWVNLLLAAERAPSPASSTPPGSGEPTTLFPRKAAPTPSEERGSFWNGSLGLGARAFDLERPLGAFAGFARFGGRWRNGLGLDVLASGAYAAPRFEAGSAEVAAVGGAAEASVLWKRGWLGYRLGVALGAEGFVAAARARDESRTLAGSSGGVAIKAEVVGALLVAAAPLPLGVEVRLGYVVPPARFRLDPEPDVLVEGVQLAAFLTSTWEERP